MNDNGTNFVVAVKKLKQLGKGNIRRKFNPPPAPHSGGVFEAMVKAAKWLFMLFYELAP